MTTMGSIGQLLSCLEPSGCPCRLLLFSLGADANKTVPQSPVRENVATNRLLPSSSSAGLISLIGVAIQLAVSLWPFNKVRPRNR